MVLKQGQKRYFRSRMVLREKDAAEAHHRSRPKHYLRCDERQVDQPAPRLLPLPIFRHSLQWKEDKGIDTPTSPDV